MPEIVDAHVHVWTDDRGRYPRVDGDARFSPDRFTPEDFFAHSEPAGVRRTVLIQMSFYQFDNRYMLDCMKSHPGRFSGVAVIDEAQEHPDQEMKRLAGQGVRGFRITPGRAADRWLDAAGMQRMWRCGAQTGQAMCPLIDVAQLAGVDRMCERFPETPVVIDHLARIGVSGEVRDGDVRSLCALARHPRVSVKVSAFYALGRKRPPYTDLAGLVRRVFEDYGPRRLMWASDCPFQVMNGHNYADSVALVRDRLPFLSAEDREWILGKTAAAVFFRAA